jgi:hypothetical protein
VNISQREDNAHMINITRGSQKKEKQCDFKEINISLKKYKSLENEN